MVGVEKDRQIGLLAFASHQCGKLTYPKKLPLSFGSADEDWKFGVGCGGDHRLQQNVIGDIEMSEACALSFQPSQNLAERVFARALVSSRCHHFCSLSLRYRRIRLSVELSCLSTGSAGFSSSGMMRCARTLPSSTPHWSNESMFQITPWVNTECSYSAMSLPSVSGVSLSTRIVFDGRLPSKTRCGISQSAVPSAFTCSAVLPNASASV